MSYKHFRIKEMSLKKFAGARDLYLEKLGQFVALVGPNGCGKSSVLKVLGKIFGDLPDKSLPQGALIEGTFERDGSADGSASPVKEPFSFSGPCNQMNRYDDVIGRYIGPNRERLQSPPRETEQKKRQLQDLEAFKDQGARHLLSELAICATECRDNVNQEIKSSAQTKWQQYARVVKELLGKTISYENDSSCDDTFHLELRLDGAHWTETYLSDGEVNLLQILFRALVVGDGIDPPTILFLDEPELHLHPENQQRLIGNLKKLIGDKTQVFIATHSPYILSCFDLPCIRYISKVGENGQQITLNGVKVYSSGLIDLMGGELAVTNQMALFNYAEWGTTYHFLNECITNPSEISEPKPEDPQCVMATSILPDKEEVSILDFGCGEGRLVTFFQDERPVLAKKIDYCGFHTDPEKISTLTKRYRNHPFRSLRFVSHLENNTFFDTIICCNVVHEIQSYTELNDACQQWKRNLGESGQLVIIEDSELRIGEINFVLFDKAELQVLLGKGKSMHSTKNDRIFCVLWDKSALNIPDEATYREAVTMVKNRAYKKLGVIEDEKRHLDGADLARTARRYGFYLSLYANASRRLSN